MIETYDALDLSDPYPFYEWARVHCPVFFDPKSRHWVITSYSDVKAVISDEARFSAEAERASYAGLSDEAVEILKPIAFDKLYGLSTTENPDHDRLKRVAMPLFNDLFARYLQPRLEMLASEFTKKIEDRSKIDLVDAIFRDFPAEAIFMLLGVPIEDVPNVKQWSESRLLLTWGEASNQVLHANNVVAYWRYSQALVEKRMDSPSDDLPSALGKAVKNGILSLHEVQLFCYGLFFSGHATTSAFLAESMRLLLSSGMWQSPPAEGWVGSEDELLRLCPSAFTRRRLALENCTIGGQAIEKNSKVLLVIGSANRDEKVFVAPNAIQISRMNAYKHLSFGHGFHYCIGAKLVRMEFSTLMNTLSRRLPDMHLSEGFSPIYSRNLSIRSPASLMVELHH